MLPLFEALSRAEFHAQNNLSEESRVESAYLLRASAVEASKKYLEEQMRKRFDEGLAGRLRKEDRRLRKWAEGRREFIEKKRAELPPESPLHSRLVRKLDHMETYLENRTQWLNRHFKSAEAATTQLVLVIEGV